MSILIYVCNLNATVGGICSASTCVLAAEAPLLEGGCVRVLSGSVPALFFIALLMSPCSTSMSHLQQVLRTMKKNGA